MILFGGALAFKGPFLNLLGISGPSQYPIYYVLEPVWDPISTELNADLFIINLDDHSLSESELEEKLKIHAGADEVTRLGTWIKLRQKAHSPDSIITIKEDSKFNNNKGELGPPKRIDGQTWGLAVKSIEARAVLRVEIRTSRHSAPISRASPEALPFEIQYAGR